MCPAVCFLCSVPERIPSVVWNLACFKYVLADKLQEEKHPESQPYKNGQSLKNYFRNSTFIKIEPGFFHEMPACAIIYISRICRTRIPGRCRTSAGVRWPEKMKSTSEGPVADQISWNCMLAPENLVKSHGSHQKVATGLNVYLEVLLNDLWFCTDADFWMVLIWLFNREHVASDEKSHVC